MKKIIFAVLIFAIPIILFSQTAFQNVYGDANDEIIKHVIELNNGDLMMVGSTKSFGASAQDVYVLKTDSDGQVLWAKRYGGASDEEGHNILQLNSGSFIITATTKSFGQGDSDGYLLKISSSGSLLWSKTYGASAFEGWTRTVVDSDGNMLMTGSTKSSFGSGNRDMLLAKVDSNGVLLWGKAIGGSNFEGAPSVHFTSNGDILIHGATNSFGAGGYDMMIVKLDSTGSLLWAKTYGGSKNEYDWGGTIVTQDGGLIKCGTSSTYGAGNFDIYIVKTDSSGNLEWSKTYGGANVDYPISSSSSIIQTSDLGYAFIGRTASFGMGNLDILVVKIDSSGNLEWSNTYGGTLDDIPYSIMQTSDGMLMISGSTLNLGAGGSDGWIIKENMQGNAVCSSMTALVSVSSPSPSISSVIPSIKSGLIEANAGSFEAVIVNVGSVICYCTSLTANFNAVDTSLAVTFTDSSVGALTWYWDFGNGNSSVLQNPTHTYTSPGNYNVCQIVSNSCFSDTLCQNVIVTCPKPISIFGYTANNLLVTFTDSSTNVTSWLWDFDDGSFSNLQNPTHTFNTAGIYNVCLITTNLCGSDTLYQLVTVTCPIPVGNFGYSANNLIVAFFDSSTNVTSWKWDFDDSSFSNLQNPTHTYTTTGIYTVCLISTNSCGSDTLCQMVTVTCPGPLSGFSYTTVGLQVTFKDTSLKGISWLWDFGDGSFSNIQNPTHTYNTDSTYTVCLIASNLCDDDTVCKSIVVSINNISEITKTSIKIYPNPANDHLIIENIPDDLIGTEMFIVDILGRTKGSYLIKHSEFKIELKHVFNGVYFIKFRSERTVITSKLVIRY